MSELYAFTQVQSTEYGWKLKPVVIDLDDVRIVESDVHRRAIVHWKQTNITPMTLTMPFDEFVSQFCSYDYRKEET